MQMEQWIKDPLNHIFGSRVHDNWVQEQPYERKRLIATKKEKSDGSSNLIVENKALFEVKTKPSASVSSPYRQTKNLHISTLATQWTLYFEGEVWYGPIFKKLKKTSLPWEGMEEGSERFVRIHNTDLPFLYNWV